VDPASIVSSNARRHLFPHKTLSKTTISALHPDETPPLTDDDGDSDLESESNPGGLTMLPAELRVIRRLADRVNILPVIGCADSLTDDKLRAVKATLKRELYEADLDFGVFTPQPVKFFERSSSKEGGPLAADGKDAADLNGEISGEAAETDSESDDEDDTESSRNVIRLRTGRRSVPPRRSRSRSRLELTEEAREPQSPDPFDSESVANVRFSASTVARSDLSPLLPFAIIAPEKYRWQKPKPAAEATVASENASSLISNSDSPTSAPDNLKGVFVRRFRWGMVDVLDPTHCDFAALRTAVLSTHMKVTTFLSAGVHIRGLMYYGQVLKTHTREILYEKYRTEKLLARRATRKIGEEQTKKLLEGVFSLLSSHPLLSTNSTLRSRVVKFHSGWFRIGPGRIWIPLLFTPPCVCLPTFSTPPRVIILFWVHSRYPWLTRLVS
jgi:hypothetical protein